MPDVNITYLLGGSRLIDFKKSPRDFPDIRCSQQVWLKAVYLFLPVSSPHNSSRTQRIQRFGERGDRQKEKGSEPCLGSVIHCTTSSKTLKSIKRLFLGSTLDFITLTLQSCEDEVKLSVWMFKNIQCYIDQQASCFYYALGILWTTDIFYFGLFSLTSICCFMAGTQNSKN